LPTLRKAIKQKYTQSDMESRDLSNMKQKLSEPIRKLNGCMNRKRTQKLSEPIG
jgi:hypothetical protein